MKKGSVIVDLAAENGGNCALTEPGTVVERYGVHILGYTDLPSRLAPTASFLYGNNLGHLLNDMGGGAGFKVDVNDEVVRGALVLLNGEVMWPPPRREAPPAPAAPAAKPSTGQAVRGHEARAEARSGASTAIALVVAAAAFVGLGLVAPPSFLAHLTVFALACIVGWQVVWNVTPALHTPLMSVTNAISGIIVIGGMLQVSGPTSNAAVLLGAAAILLATINIAGGFLVTQRMLKMFSRR
jgi:H+-translocating NAD(P) transhydrogenase subunit alpha